MRSRDLSWEEQSRADAGRLWAGGVATALVAAGVALVGVMVLHKLLHVAVLTPGGRTAVDSDATTVLPISAALATLLATGLLHLLMETTPRASQFFAWITSLVMALLVLEVFVAGTDLVAEMETSAFYLLIGVAIISSLFGVSRTAVRYHRRQDYRENYSDEAAYRHEPGRYR
jgi:hypothetical protein